MRGAGVGVRSSVRTLVLAVIAILAVSQATAGAATPKAPKAVCTINGVGFDQPLTSTAVAARVVATGSCKARGRVVPGRWTYSYRFSASRHAATCDALASSGVGNAFTLDRLGAASLGVTFTLAPRSSRGRAATLTRSLKLLNGFNGCDPLALPELPALTGSNLSITYAPDTNPSSGVGVGKSNASQCNWDVPAAVMGNVEDPGFVVSGDLTPGWSVTPGSALGNFYPSAVVALTDGQPAWASVFVSLATPTHAAIRLVVQSLEPTPPACAPLATEPGPNGPAIPVTIGIAESNLNDGWDGIGCGYLTFAAGEPARVSIAVTDAKPVFTNAFDVQCSNGKLPAP